MVKWIDEKVLQRYFMENCSEYSIRVEGEKREIEQCEFNQPFDRFPDVYCAIDGEEYPAEVEWLSSYYDHFDHSDHDRFIDQGGFLVVFRKDTQVGNFQQVEIDREHFKSWFDSQAAELFEESVEDFEREAVKQRDYPKIWIIYISGTMERNFEVGQAEGVWGFGDGRFGRHSDEIRQIQSGDIVLFYGPVNNTTELSSRIDGTYAPRRSFDTFYGWVEEHELLELDTVVAYKVTEGYWNEEERDSYRPVWPDEDAQNQKYPHRFEFETTKILSFDDVPLHEIAEPTVKTLHYPMYQTLQEIEYQHFLEIISNFTGGSGQQQSKLSSHFSE